MTRKFTLSFLIAVITSICLTAQQPNVFTINPSDSAIKHGVYKFQVEQNDNQYIVDVIGVKSVLGQMIILEEPLVTTLKYRDNQTNKEFVIKYGERMQWVEFYDPETKKRGRSEFIESDGKKPKRIKKDDNFKELELKNKSIWELMVETAGAVLEQDDEVSINKNEVRLIKAKAVCAKLITATARAQCFGTYCRRSAYSFFRSTCCQWAKNRVQNCCGMNAYCIGCCSISDCDAFCGAGDYFCSVCGVTGRKCSGS